LTHQPTCTKFIHVATSWLIVSVYLKYTTLGVKKKGDQGSESEVKYGLPKEEILRKSKATYWETLGKQLLDNGKN